jgi:hypothetical protein
MGFPSHLADLVTEDHGGIEGEMTPQSPPIPRDPLVVCERVADAI